MTMKIRKPANWENMSLDDLMSIDAGQAYVLDQFDYHHNPVQPDHCFRSSRENQDTASYEVYEDDSLWFSNNSQDEVWADYHDAVRDSLIPGLAAVNTSKGMCWTQGEVDDSDDINAFAIDDMDRQLLLLYCDEDEDAARELAGI